MMTLRVLWGHVMGVLLGMGFIMADQVQAEDAGSFRVATFNIRCPADRAPNAWTCRVGRVCGVIDKQGFDLMGLQEATAGQIDDLLTKGWDVVGGGRDDGKRRGEASCIFFRIARFDLRDTGTFWLSETPEVPGSKSWDTACTRVCTWARLLDRKTGREFVHFNTHLDHMSAAAREHGMALILARIPLIAQGRPVILTGDMNATPGAPPIRLATSVLHDAAAISRTPHTGTLATFNAFKSNPAPTAQIDYIFVSDNVRVLTHATVNDSEEGLYPSDHFPVMADVVLE